MFTVKRAARHFDRVAADAFFADGLGFMEGLLLAAIFFEAPRPIKPSHLAETFATTLNPAPGAPVSRFTAPPIASDP